MTASRQQWAEAASVHAALAGKQRGRQEAAVGSAARVLFYPMLLYNVVRDPGRVPVVGQDRSGSLLVLSPLSSLIVS
jgi:hypothetical protein